METQMVDRYDPGPKAYKLHSRDDGLEFVTTPAMPPSQRLRIANVPEKYISEIEANGGPFYDGLKRHSPKLKGWNGQSNLLIHGPVGRGKTVLAAGILWKANKAGAHWINWVGFTESLKKAWKLHDGSEAVMVERAKRARLLIIDDLAKGLPLPTPEKPNLGGWERELAHEIISWRYEHMLHNIITTEYQPWELVDRVSKATISRILESCVVIDLSHQPEFRMKNRSS